MGKLTSIYLTDDEAAKLKKFCDENQCTQYSALKTAIRELMSRRARLHLEYWKERFFDDTEKRDRISRKMMYKHR